MTARFNADYNLISRCDKVVPQAMYWNVRWRIIGGAIGCRSIRAPENSIAWLICVKPAACTIASRPIPDGLCTPRYSHIPVSRIALKPRQSDSSDARGRETQTELIAMDIENPGNPTISQNRRFLLSTYSINDFTHVPVLYPFRDITGTWVLK